ncbi:protein-glutamate O-methyltransferase CheR [Halostagnicola sp. A-GB9-2]|uniref:CheR family methyltransferase n=1 Tax=Halostagnicola sp. A-GB9-2 TaxID=3048066 RepID=UPI0024C048CF|nr:protein-glutamate O-methyltransferase CheR [Halostagnicola sp. A-GB9-2]MDJ1432228.1 protein-glutamate O-methyltransferase CheR [Halostagnicola sp. A-GB9-2]
MNTSDTIQPILEFVEEELSFATSYYNERYLDRRVSSRMRRTDSESYRDYFSLLKRDETEQEELLDALSINVTGFFRNPSVWEGIQTLLRKLTDEQSHVRIWSAACADGREPYSLSMLAHSDRKIDESRISILATDISDDALETARGGVYQDLQTDDVSSQLDFLERPNRYITKGDGHIEVADTIQEPVEFERHDLINGRSKSGFDMVVCRNILIYINDEHKTPIFETIRDSLEEGGYMVIGKSETIPLGMRREFDSVNAGDKTYQYPAVE